MWVRGDVCSCLVLGGSGGDRDLKGQGGRCCSGGLPPLLDLSSIRKLRIATLILRLSRSDKLCDTSMLSSELKARSQKLVKEQAEQG